MSRCSCGESLGVVAVNEFVDVVYLENLAGRAACEVVGFHVVGVVCSCFVCIGFRPVFH